MKFVAFPRSLQLVVLSAIVAGCASAPKNSGAANSAPSAPIMSIVAFGDHGYDLDYLEEEDRLPARTLEQAVALEREEWLEDKRPPAEFQPSSMVRLPSTGGYVLASGMMPVAKAMYSYCRSVGCDAGVMLGDNVYPNGPTGGTDGVPDAKRFEKIFRDPFRNFGELAPSFRIYSTLGNHDWRTSREAAMSEVRYLETTRPFYMDGIRYQVKPPAGHAEVEIFALDTEVLLAGATVYEPKLADDGSELPPDEIEEPEPWTKPATDEERNMVEWLERAMSESNARWKIVIGHHPLWSSAGSKYEQAKVMRRLLLPTLCRHADMYLAGHEHTLEVHTDDCSKVLPNERVQPLLHLVSGAAAKHRPLHRTFMEQQEKNAPELTKLYTKGIIWGFLHVALHREEAVVTAVTTPNNGDGSTQVEFTRAFPSR